MQTSNDHTTNYPPHPTSPHHCNNKCKSKAMGNTVRSIEQSIFQLLEAKGNLKHLDMIHF